MTWRRLVIRLLDVLFSKFMLAWVGATLISVAVYQAFGVTFGWWGFMFWAGIGLLIAGTTKK